MKNTILLLFLFIVALAAFGCKEKEEDKSCSSRYLQDIDGIKAAYRAVYTADATSADATHLNTKISQFLSAYAGVNCESGGRTYNLTGELEAFQSDIARKSRYGLVSSKVVYGDDNRVEVVDADDSRYIQWASATAAQIASYQIDVDGMILSETLQESYDLCAGERFADQMNPARCSGFLVAPDIIITAGHCMETEADCWANQWVFDFYDDVTTVDLDDVYSCAEILHQDNSYSGDYGPDYAVIRLDRPVTDRAPLYYRSTGKVRDGANLVVIGNPSGLPTKIADDAVVRTNTASAYFVTNLDTFGGNSGSAVFDADTGIVEGILVRGDTDYIYSQQPDGRFCRIVNALPENGGEGEDVTRMTVVQGIPEVDYSVAADISFGDAVSGILDSQNYSKSSSYGVIPYYYYEQDGYILAGRKFLGLCGMHVLQSGDSRWLGSEITDCAAKDSLTEVFNRFSFFLY